MTKRTKNRVSAYPRLEGQYYRCSDGAAYTDRYMALEHEKEITEKKEIKYEIKCN